MPIDLDRLMNQQMEASPPAAATSQQWSPLQEAFFQAIQNPSHHIQLEAVAGSGKTTTILEAQRRLWGGLYLAFNREIAETTRRKLTCGEAKTFNALGNALWRAYRPAAKLDDRKSETLLKNAIGEDSVLYREHGYAMKRLVGLAKNNAYLPQSIHQLDIESLIDAYQFEIPADMLSEAAHVVTTVFKRSCAIDDSFDFDDQLFGPILHGWAFPGHSNIFVDEDQDLSPIQHHICAKLIESGSRLIGVGDRRQAIYGFRGALSNSIDLLKSRFGMLELPLSITYRCPLSVVREAQKICPDIQARDGAPEGKVLRRDQIDTEGVQEFFDDPELFTRYQLVMCRNNAPLFAAILRHVRAKSPCRVKTNFLDGFQGFVRSFKCSDTKTLLERLEKWYIKEREAAEAKRFLGKLAGLADKYQTVKLLASEFRFVEDILSLVKNLQNGTQGPVFSTIHKAKGLEAPHCYLLRPDCIPAIYARTEEQLVQEYNLLYVAITRAQESFTYGVPRQ